ncbi:MAG: helicase-exonuclease AddAB subunit AddB [bacterium]|nr:helicase-exonuclease AddAB subunit AddB [bacterium]
MSLQYILGASGCGKTAYVYQHLIEQSLKEPERMFFLIVPEQFTMQAQKDIVTLHPSHAMMNLDVLSFERLAYRVFEELSLAQPMVLDDMGKSMVLRRVSADVKKNLGFYAGKLDKVGFISQLKSMISELYQYGVTPDDLSTLSEKVEGMPLFHQKLHDLEVIYREFQNYIQGNFITSEEILDVLCRELTKSELLKNSVIALDGFTGFTPIQYRLLERFLYMAERVWVTVTIDSREDLRDEVGEENLFYMSRRMLQRITNLAEKQHIRIEKSVHFRENPALRFEKAPELAYLERNLLRYPVRGLERPMQNLRLHKAINPQEEVSMTAKEISRLVEQEGFAYKDIAVVCGDLEGYGKELLRQFSARKIPCFLDEKKNILANPAAELLRAALEVLNKDFSYEAVFRYLKTGFVTEEKEKLCRMENYVIALGIRGHSRWNSVWERSYRGAEGFDMEEMNAFRQEIVAPLNKLREGMKKKGTVQEWLTALVELLETLEVEKKLLHKKQEFEAGSEWNLAKEYEQVYELLLTLFDRLAGLLGEERLSRKEFADILDAGLAELKVGLIPACVDRVVIGNVKRTRTSQIKVLFFLGINEGKVPFVKENSGVLSEKERQIFDENALELAPSAREDGFEQQFYLYLTMTKPSTYLYLSYVLLSAAGKSERPSFLISHVRKLFPKLLVQTKEEAEKTAIYSRQDAWEQLCVGLRENLGDGGKEEERAKFLELYRWFFDNEETREEALRLVEASVHSYQGKSGIGRAAAKAVYGSTLQGSVTRLEQFASCAYAHFLKYGLDLSERQEYRLEAIDIGNLFHSSIEHFFRQLTERGLRLPDLKEEERKALVQSSVEACAREYGNTILFSTARNTWLTGRVERITERTVWALGEQLKRGDFEPSGMEIQFSSADNLKAMRISLSEQEELRLKGRIDRLDLCEDENHVYVKIIDYKSGSTSFDLAAFYRGTQLQLVVYLDAVMEMQERRTQKEVVPAGIFYYNIADPMIEASAGEYWGDEQIEGEILKALRMNGLVNSQPEVIRHLDATIREESEVIPVVLKNGAIQESRSSVADGERFALLRRFAREKLKSMGQEILEGKNEARPTRQGVQTACDYCPYHAVCGFDLKTEGYSYRVFQKVGTEEIWQEMQQRCREFSKEGMEENRGEKKAEQHREENGAEDKKGGRNA